MNPRQWSINTFPMIKLYQIQIKSISLLWVAFRKPIEIDTLYGKYREHKKRTTTKIIKNNVMGDKSDGFAFFFVFSRFFGFWPQVAKTLRKAKWSKKCRWGDYMRPNISLKSLLFFESFWFLTKSGKTLEKTKKHTKKAKIRRLYEARHFPQIFVYCFFVLFLFSRGCCYFWSKTKNRETKKRTKKRKNKNNQKNQKK